MSPASAVTPSVPAFSPAGVDVVGEGDPRRVASQQRDLARASGRSRGEATTLSKPAWWAIRASV